MADNAKLLKSLSGKTSANKGGSAVDGMLAQLKKVPGVNAIGKSIKAAKPKQMVDIAIFTLGIYLMYRFGKAVAETIDNQMPTEKSMMDMMKSMQGPPGMPPPPM